VEGGAAVNRSERHGCSVLQEAVTRSVAASLNATSTPQEVVGRTPIAEAERERRHTRGAFHPVTPICEEGIHHEQH
jgi:hypothetical protein